MTQVMSQVRHKFSWTAHSISEGFGRITRRKFTLFYGANKLRIRIFKNIQKGTLFITLVMTSIVSPTFCHRVPLNN
jgi:hypothetical protein